MAEAGKKKAIQGASNRKKTSQRKKTSSTSSGKSRASKNSGQTRQKKGAGNSRLQDEIMVLLSFAAALILILSNFNLAGSIGQSIKWFMFGIFGVIEYIFPFIMAFTLVFMISNKDIIAVVRVKTAAVYVLTVILSGVWQRISNVPQLAQTGVGEFFTYSAEHKTGGGFFGGLLCKIMEPIGFWGSMVIFVILAIICIVIITEKSFINGVMNMKNSGTRMMHAAKQDYDIYREYSNERLSKSAENEEDNSGETEEEYLRRRRLKKEEKLRERLEKQEQRERRAESRMDKKVRGVTLDTQLPREESVKSSIDIHEIMPDIQRTDEYTPDIYDPSEAGEPVYTEHVIAPIPDTEAREQQVFYDTPDIEKEEPKNEAFKTYPANAEEPDAVLPEISAADAAEQAGKAEISELSASQSASQDVSQSASQNAAQDVSQSAAQNAPQSTVQSAPARMNTADEQSDYDSYVFPPTGLLSKGRTKNLNGQSIENRETAMRLTQTLQNFGVKVTITDISCGPSVTRYELQPEQGVKVSKIVSLSDDIKLNLAAADIRIEAPIPGKAAIGIEVPNKEPGSVSLRELVESDTFKNNPSSIAFAAGKDIAGKIIVADIAKMPHLLIAGATGSGKSVCINTIIMSILFKAHPDDVKLIMIDPKVVELSVYNGIPHLLTPVVTDPKKASGALSWAVNEMTDRYKKFAQMNVRDLKGYNAKIEKLEVGEGETPPSKMPQIVIIIDELADLMMVAPGEVEDSICRLAQLARAAGIHLIIATQRPSVNVITGLIKANVPSRIAFSVSSGVDSRIIIDMNGAEKLLGKGDMLFFPSGYPKPLRVQGAFVSDEEVGKVVDFLKEHMKQEVSYNEEVTNTIASAQTASDDRQENERDSYFADAGRFVIEKEKGSIGMLQRYYKIGFNRAGRIMDQLAEAGVVGPELGTKPRKILMTLEEFEAYLKQNNL